MRKISRDTIRRLMPIGSEWFLSGSFGEPTNGAYRRVVSHHSYGVKFATVSGGSSYLRWEKGDKAFIERNAIEIHVPSGPGDLFLRYTPKHIVDKREGVDS